MAPAAGEGGQAGPAAGPQHAVDPVAVHVGHPLAPAGGDPLGDQLEHGLEVGSSVELGVGRRPGGPGPAVRPRPTPRPRPPRPRSAGPGCRGGPPGDGGGRGARRAPRPAGRRTRPARRGSAGRGSPRGSRWREWLERPTRWRKVAMARGEPTWQTSSTGPMSIPSSSEAVATSARRSPARSRSSTRWRRSLDRLPWWAATCSGPSRSARRWARRSDIRRVFTKTRVVRWSGTWSAMRSMTSPNCSVEATAASSVPGSSMERSRSPARGRSRRWRSDRPGPTPGEQPGRLLDGALGGRQADPLGPGTALRCSSRSRVRARCEPRLSRARAWISSTITVSTVAEQGAARVRR